MNTIPRLHTFEMHFAHLFCAEALDTNQEELRQPFRAQEAQQTEPWNVWEQRAIAAIIKTRCDILLWEPLVLLGVANSFNRHRAALEEDRQLLLRNNPTNAFIKQEWSKVFNQISDAIPPHSGQ